MARSWDRRPRYHTGPFREPAPEGDCSVSCKLPGSDIGALWRITSGRNAVREHAAVVPCLGLTLLVGLVVACAPRDQETGGLRELSGEGWIDVTATLDPARTPVYLGDAPMKFDFLKDMRKGDI